MNQLGIVFKTVRFGSPEYREALRTREDVMRRPLGLCLSEEDLKGEERRIHIAGYAGAEQVCGCALNIIHGKLALIAFFYVRPEFQKQGCGRGMMHFLEEYAAASGVRRLYAEAREAARGFYEKCGFRKSGHVYVDTGLRHQDMKKDIGPREPDGPFIRP